MTDMLAYSDSKTHYEQIFIFMNPWRTVVWDAFSIIYLIFFMFSHWVRSIVFFKHANPKKIKAEGQYKSFAMKKHSSHLHKENSSFVLFLILARNNCGFWIAHGLLVHNFLLAIDHPPSFIYFFHTTFKFKFTTFYLLIYRSMT